MGEVLCELRGIRKSFGGVRALDGVDVEIEKGEIHALVGENGAGKSTLIRILCGVIQADAGEVRFDGRPERISSPRAARDLGVAAAHQDPRLFASRSAEENCFNQGGLPGRPLISWSRVRRESRAALAELEARFPGARTVRLLSASQRQMVALAGAFLARPRLVILDEPTATLSASESGKLFSILREMRGRGTSVIYVSHRLEEVLALADRITILRDGRLVRTVTASAMDSGSLVEAMVGRRIETLHPRPPEPAEGGEVLAVEDLADAQGVFRDVSFTVRRGEVLGIYGLVGAGRTEIGQALAGLRPARGRVTRRASVAYLPEDRIREGNLPGLSIRENLSIACLRSISRGPFPDRRRERALTASLREKFRIRAPDLEAEIGTLSGGNQQKALLARWMPDRPGILVLDEPTQGVDVGAKVEIHQIIDGLARDGVAVVLISSDLPEVRGMSHRLLVIREGRPAAVFDSAATPEEEIARAAFPRAGPDERGASKQVHSSFEGRLHRELALAAAIAVLLVATWLKAPGFLSAGSLWGSAANGASLAVAALGETLVIASGAIDISIGSILALSATAGVLAAGPAGSAPLAFAAAILLGAALGSINAAISFLGRLHPIITTMGTMGIFHGLFLHWKGGDWLILPDELRALATEGPLGVPVSVWGVGAVAAAISCFLRWTRAGRACLKVGDDPEAAQVHGLRVGLTRWIAFAILGGATGLAGVFHTARFGSVQNNTGEGFEIQAIAAAVLGGAHVAGGRGTVAGALLGSAFIALLQDARSVWGIEERWQLVIIGSLMLGTLALETLLGRLRLRRKR
jgi:ABC-type sugar transport system ATPase subunit/ribose/xylose/arabinose/galactoside ABC-type transport system permease subunit